MTKLDKIKDCNREESRLRIERDRYLSELDLIRDEPSYISRQTLLIGKIETIKTRLEAVSKEIKLLLHNYKNTAHAGI